MRRIRVWLRALLRRSVVEREMHAEMQYHLEQAVARLLARGLSRDAALLEARREFGNLPYFQDEARAARGVVFVGQLARDFGHAVRGLRRQPVFVAVVVATFGLGVGVNAAMFSILDRMFLRPPRYLSDPEH